MGGAGIPATCCSEGRRWFPTTHSAGTWSADPMAEPPVKIDPLTVPMDVVPDDFDSASKRLTDPGAHPNCRRSKPIQVMKRSPQIRQ